MDNTLLTDEKWNEVKHLIPDPPRSPKGGRQRIDTRRTLMAILFILRNGITWTYLPSEKGCGSGATAWRRMREWHQQGILRPLLQHFAEELGEEGRQRAEELMKETSFTFARALAQTPEAITLWAPRNKGARSLRHRALRASRMLLPYPPW